GPAATAPRPEKLFGSRGGKLPSPRSGAVSLDRPTAPPQAGRGWGWSKRGCRGVLGLPPPPPGTPPVQGESYLEPLLNSLSPPVGPAQLVDEHHAHVAAPLEIRDVRVEVGRQEVESHLITIDQV